MRRALRCAMLALATLVAGAASAVDRPLPPIPEHLRDTIAWTMPDLARRSCALREGHNGQQTEDFSCVDSSLLRLTRRGEGLSFDVDLVIQQPETVVLPGGAEWPQQVLDNGREAMVREDNGQLVLDLAPGTHRLSGHWPSAGGSLTVPATYGPASLDGQVLLQQGTQVLLAQPVAATQTQTKPREPSVRVYRKLDDGQALILTTQVVIDNDNAGRRLVMGPALPPGFDLTGWQSEVPAVVASDGTLHVQAGPGRSTVAIMGRCTSACLLGNQSQVRLERGKRVGAWPAEEVWSFQANAAFRQANLEGNGIDANAAEVPDIWRTLPAYRISDGIVLRQHSRGRTALAEQWHLNRRGWLWEGQWILLDTLNGQRLEGGRIGLVAPYKLERATIDGRSAWITEDKQGRGLSTARASAVVNAQGVMPAGRAPLTGWSMPIEKMETEISLIPGQVLLAAPGANDGNAAWVERLSLLAFFGAALFALVVRQALGWRAGFLAGLMVLAWVGHGTVQWLFWWMGLAAVLIVVAPLVPDGWLGRLVRWGQWLALGLAAWVLVGVAIHQSTLVLHPDLEGAGDYSERVNDQFNAFPGGRVRNGDANSLDSPVYQNIGSGDSNSLAMYKSVAELAAPAAPPMPMNAPDPLAALGVSLAGRADPQWASEQPVQIGKTYSLTYEGPLRVEDSGRLWILPQGLVRVLRAIGLLGLAWLAAAMAWRVGARNLRRPSPRWVARLGLALVLAPCLAMASQPAGQSSASVAPSAPAAPPDVQREIERPDREDVLLGQVRAKLEAPPVCAPNCAQILEAELVARGEGVSINWRIAAHVATGWNLPGVEGARLLEVRVDGQPARYLSADALRLSPGLHRVETRYQALGGRLQIKPNGRVVLAQQTLGSDWQAAPLVQGHLPGGVWLIEQAKTTASEGQAMPAGAGLDSFVRIERVLKAEGSLTLTTTITRQGRPGALRLLVPGVRGERMQSSRAKQQGDDWEVMLAEGENQIELVSQLALDPKQQVALRAIDASDGVEEWRLDASELWTVEAQGVPQAPATAGGALVRRWLPLGKETLVLTLSRLPAAQGPSQRIDSAQLTTQSGPREARHALTLAMTATQAGTREISVPSEATDIEVLHNGLRLAPVITKGQMTLPVMAGSQQFTINFRTDSGSLIQRSPRVALGGLAGNIRWHLEGASERGWLLMAGGPGIGMAVLYWSQLLALLALAWAASRLPGQMAGWREALLLALGFSTFNAGGLLVLVVWRGLVWLREQDRWPQRRMSFNIAQLGLVAATALALLVAIGMVSMGLLGEHPDMLLRAPRGLALYDWFVPQDNDGVLEGPWMMVAPLWIYRVLLLGWAIWFAHWLVREVRRAFAAWRQGGYWREGGNRAQYRDEHGETEAPSGVAIDPVHEPKEETRAP